MKSMDMIRGLRALDAKGIYVLSKRDIAMMFPDEGDKAMEKSLQRLVGEEILVRAAKGVYVNPIAASRSGYIIQDIAKALRPGCLCYVSLEYALSEYGLISQIPVSLITIMTTGAKGTCETPYGTIEFTHTKRSFVEVIASTQYMEGRPLRIATRQAAVRDLLRVGRNVNMLDQDALRDMEESV